MRFKKGDIVEVINEENFFGIEYPVGTHWVVARDQVEEHHHVSVHDFQQNNRGNQAIFWDFNVKLIKRATPVDGQHKITLDDLAQDALETTFTLTQVRDSIVKAYQLFDNDSQRVAFLQGYFAK